MTALLEQAVSEAGRLSAEEQDWVASQILALLADEREWDRQFSGSPDVLAEMADEALAAYEAGRTTRIS